MRFHRKKRIYVPFIILILIIVVGSAHWVFHSVQANKKTTLPEVHQLALQQRQEPIILKAYGKVLSPKSLPIYPQFSGLVTRIAVKHGAAVRRGEVLFVVRITGISSELQAKAAALAAARNQYLKDEQLAHISQASIAKITLQNTRDNYHRARALYQQTLAQYRSTSITAPADGHVMTIAVAQGQYVTPQTLLTRFVHPQVVVEYALPSRWYAHLKLGQSIEFSQRAHGKISGKVTYIAPQQNQAFETRLRARLATGVVPNSFGQVTQTIPQTRKILVVPQRYAYTDDEGYYVFTVQKTTRGTLLQKRYFQPAWFYANGLISIESGLRVGEKIVASRDTTLTTGQPVQLVSAS